MKIKKPKVIIVMPAYNAEKTLEKTFKDIPKGLADEVILVDDNSNDNTVKVARKLGITVIEHSKNLGYGGNQKTCYETALKKGADIVIMLHPDYQYDARLLDKLIDPIKDGEYDMMFGSRIRTRKEALAGGMPKIKYFLNRSITPVENTILGVNFSEHLSGLRAYHKRLLKKVPFKLFSNDFVFDQQMVASAVSYGFKINETPVPVRYFSESSSIKYIKGIKFLLSTLLVLLQYFLHNQGIVSIKFLNNKKKNVSTLFLFILILVTVFLAYGQTINMYFWQDDNALIFKLQNIDVGAGSFGTGIFGRDGLYKYLVTPFVPLYPVFKLNASWYFFGGVIMYFLSSISVFYLGQVITKNKKVAFFGALIYSAGYIGSDTMWRIINSYQTAIAVILLSLSTITYKIYTEKKTAILYMVAFIFFLLTIEIGFIRGHGIIFIILGLELMYNFDRYSILRVVPYILMYYKYYLYGNTSSSHLRDYAALLFSRQFFKTVSIPVETFKNTLIPEQVKINGWLVLLVVTLIGLLRKNKEIFFFVIFIIANFITYIIHYPDQFFVSTHRYLTPSFAGSALLVSLILYKLLGKTRFYGKACIVIVLFLLFLVNIDEYRIVNDRSIPAKTFFNDLKTEVPKLEKGSILYFDVREDGKSQIEFGNFFGVGSMPETTAIAIYYGLDRYDVEMTRNFQELVSKIKQKRININKVYTFYYSAFSGLKNTSTQTRKELTGPNQLVEVADFDEINFHHISPAVLEFTTQITFDENLLSSKNTFDVKKYLAYLLAREEYYNSAVATTSSEWKYQEKRYLLDDDINTTWRGHRMYWHHNKYENVEIDLKSVRKISAVRIFNGTVKNSPLSYNISCFNTHWKNIGKYNNLIKKDLEITTIKFPQHECSKVLISISSTLNGDSPEAAEIEVINSGFEDIDYEKLQQFLENPIRTTSKRNITDLYKYISENGWKVKACVTLNNTDLEDSYCKRTKVYPDQRRVSFAVPNGGTKIRKFLISSPDGMKIVADKATVKALNLSELEKWIN